MSDPILAIDWRARFVALSERQRIQQEASSCEHNHFSLVRVAYKGGKEFVRQLCDECYVLFGNLRGRSSVPQFDSLPLVDKEEREKYRHTQWQAQYQRRQEDYHSAFFDLYTRYLASPGWLARRALVMQRANRVCEGCLSRPAVMVHHLTYEHVGDELLFELRAICAPCHEKCHEDRE